MTIALRKQLELQPARPETSFGPFKLLHALPWLILAAAMRVIAFGGGVALPATIVSDLSILLAFFATAQRSIEVAGGQSSLGELTMGEQFKLSLAIFWRIALLMIAATIGVDLVGRTTSARHLMSGLDGVAFDQFTHLGRFWSASIATLVLLMIVRAERSNGQIALFAAIAEFGRRGLWLGAAVVVLGLLNIALGFGQELVRSAIWNFWQTSAASQFTKNLIYFCFIFSFAMLRLWLTLTILTLGLRQSYVRAD
ncbi:hypothetical protein [Bradyrhizobium liaoningense]|uniref:hypothetical protein n=1 Tax=Bradyrhizobium liaoningense TaxID=43992 RepID=UPI001BAC87F2|nr:hypothetical protein [Bradyrhizobium liaoningense]MBR0713443.1 hypothetical protein [Bradyrhizobium liaoningense]